jgi:hypothetical protein
MNCIVCGKPSSNTMTVDGSEIGLCGDHVDNITIKQIRELLQKRNSKQGELRLKLQKMDEERNKILVELGENPQKQATPVIQAQPISKAPNTEPQQKLKSIPQPVYRTGNIKSADGPISQYPALNIDSTTRNAIEAAKRKGVIGENTVVPIRLEQREQVVLGRGGASMRVPSMIKDTTGTTTIRVVNTGGDAALQKRAKIGAVELPNCPACGGMGHNDNIPCKKCGGDGILRTKWNT